MLSKVNIHAKSNLKFQRNNENFLASCIFTKKDSAIDVLLRIFGNFQNSYGSSPNFTSNIKQNLRKLA